MIDGCERADLGGRSVARVWDEALLDGIRRDVPAPTVHARNLFHTSAAMWDAWAAYDPDAEGYFVDEKHEADDVRAAREAAISYAAYRVLLHRYSYAAGLQATFDELVATMESLCYRIDFTSTEGDSPAALGNRIARAVIDAGRDDGSEEPRRYIDTDYRPVNQPLVVAEPGARMVDPNRWQPLALAQNVAQNGLPIPGNVQRFVGPQWGNVSAFALPASAEGLPVDPGPPPQLGDDPASAQAFKQAAVDVILDSSYLDPGDGATIDIGPGSFGDNPLGTNDGDGYDVNPSTGDPYTPNVVARGDFARGAGRVLGRRARSRRHPPATGTPSRTTCPTAVTSSCASAERVPRSTGWSGTSSCTSPSTGRCTTPRSRPGARRGTTTRPARSR